MDGNEFAFVAKKERAAGFAMAEESARSEVTAGSTRHTFTDGRTLYELEILLWRAILNSLSGSRP